MVRLWRWGWKIHRVTVTARIVSPMSKIWICAGKVYCSHGLAWRGKIFRWKIWTKVCSFWNRHRRMGLKKVEAFWTCRISVLSFKSRRSKLHFCSWMRKVRSLTTSWVQMMCHWVSRLKYQRQGSSLIGSHSILTLTSASQTKTVRISNSQHRERNGKRS